MSLKSTRQTAGILFILGAILVNIPYLLLIMNFDYPPTSCANQPVKSWKGLLLAGNLWFEPGWHLRGWVCPS